MSIISPKYSSELVKLYEKVNHTSGDFKLEKHNSFTFLVLMHSSIQLIGITFHNVLKLNVFKAFEDIFKNPKFIFRLRVTAETTCSTTNTAAAITTTTNAATTKFKSKCSSNMSTKYLM